MKIGIIGGGTMGLTLALRIARRGHRVTVLEAGDQVGGLATWFDYGDFTWDQYYHVILGQDSCLRGLIDDLGIGSQFRTAQTQSGFIWRGRHISMNNHWEFLTFPALNLMDKARLALGLLRCQRIHDPEPLERITATRWMTDMFGRRVYEAIWEPLLESKYGPIKNEMPATIMWATIKRYFGTRSKGAGKESMGYLAGGFKTLYDAFEKTISDHDGVIRCSMPAESIEEIPGAGVEVKAGGETFAFDRVISTIPTAMLRRIAPRAMAPDERSGEGPKFLGIICMALVLKRPLSPYYVTNLIQKGFPFTGVIEVSALTGTEPFGGRHLVMLPRYDVPESPWFEKTDAEIAKIFIDGLRSTWPGIDENIERWFVNREKKVQAIWIKEPPKMHGPARSPSGKIWNVNAELAGRDTLNNNAIVRVADRAAEEFLGSLESRAESDESAEPEYPEIAVAQ